MTICKNLMVLGIITAFAASASACSTCGCTASKSTLMTMDKAVSSSICSVKNETACSTEKVKTAATCCAKSKATCNTAKAKMAANCCAKNMATFNTAKAETASNTTCSVANKATCSKKSKATCTVKSNPLHVHSDNTNIVQVAAHSGNFKTLLAAAKAAGIVDVLNGPGPITIFAPTDEAFAKLPKGTVESLLKPENKKQLVSILTYHVIPGKLQLRMSPATMQGSNISIRSESPIMINNAKVLVSDINATNGLIHAIDTVLLPQKTTGQPVAKAEK